jgi:hypothetical protein
MKNLKNECQQQMKNQVDDIIEAIESGHYDFDSRESDYGGPCAVDYLEDMLDYNFRVSRDKQYMSARILVAFGGPNIWIDTGTREVQGYWGSDTYIRSYSEDKLGVDDYMEEIYNYF